MYLYSIAIQNMVKLLKVYEEEFHMDKGELRKEIKLKRENIDRNTKLMADEKIRKTLLESDIYKNSKVVFIYVNMDSEVNTVEIIKELLASDKKVAVPKVIPVSLKERQMKALKIDSLLQLNEAFLHSCEYLKPQWLHVPFQLYLKHPPSELVHFDQNALIYFPC